MSIEIKEQSQSPMGKVILVQGVFDERFFNLASERKFKKIFMLEGRPTLKAARVTSKGLLKRKIAPTLITDNMAGFLFFKKMVQEVWLAYQLLNRNGAICEVGALILAVLSKRHKIPVNLFPTNHKTRLMGNQRDLFYFNNVKVVPSGVGAYVPLVEWVPRKYITKVYQNQ